VQGRAQPPAAVPITKCERGGQVFTSDWKYHTDIPPMVVTTEQPQRDFKVRREGSIS